MSNEDWSTLDIGKSENEAWFYSKVLNCIGLRHSTSLKTQNV